MDRMNEENSRKRGQMTKTVLVTKSNNRIKEAVTPIELLTVLSGTCGDGGGPIRNNFMQNLVLK